MGTNPVAALFEAVEGEIDPLEPFLDLFNQAGMGLDVGQGARHVHFITRRRYSFLFLVAPVIMHPRPRLVAFMIENLVQGL